MVKKSKIFHPAGGQTLMQTRVLKTKAETTALFSFLFPVHMFNTPTKFHGKKSSDGLF